MLVRQLQLQRIYTGGDPGTLTGEELEHYIRYNVLALTDELHEALGEISWKPWQHSGLFNRDAYLKELIDAFHFWMNLVIAAGHETVADAVAELERLYFHKADINQKRQDNGYDGVSSKCACGRDIEDGDGQGTTRTSHDKLVYIYECPCGRFNGLEKLSG